MKTLSVHGAKGADYAVEYLKESTVYNFIK